MTGFDLCFSAPKSVSALWAVGGPQVAREVAAAHRAAVRAGLDYLEGQAAVSRRGRDGVEQVTTGGFAAAVFDHRTSRAGDPQLHSHALVLNKLWCADGVWRTIDGHEVYHHKKAAGTVYQAALRAELTGRLQVGFDEPHRHGQAEVAGVPAQLVEWWSKRTATITADAQPVIDRFEADLGRDLTAAERASVVQTSVLKTRPAKTHADPGQLQRRWIDEARRHGWTATDLHTAVTGAAAAAAAAQQQRRRRGQERMSAMERALTPLGYDPQGNRLSGHDWPGQDWMFRDGVVRDALAAVAARTAVFSRADLAAEIAARLPARPLTAAVVRARVKRLTATALDDREAVRVGVVRSGVTCRESDTRWTTATQLVVERRILATAVTGLRAGRAVVAAGDVQRHVAAAGLDTEQEHAVARLTGDGAQVVTLIAPAGAGKTRTLGAACNAWQAAGHPVVGLAPSARAAAELASATGGHADTVAKWLHDHHAGQAGERMRVGAGAVLVVDEASMLATADLAALVEVTAGAGAKLVLVGDPAQIGPVERAGGLLPALARRVAAVELTGIHRFTHPWEAAATQLLRHGEPAVVDTYAAAGRIHPAADSDTALDAVHTRWRNAAGAGQDALMMARSRADVDALNHRARAAALADGAVGGPLLAHAGGRDWQAGDILRARRNNRRLRLGESHLRNGDRFRVTAAAPGGGLVVQDLAGRGSLVLPGE